MQVNASSLYFIFGGVSKLIATVVTYPVQVFQTRARVCYSYSFMCVCVLFLIWCIEWIACCMQ